MSWQSYVDDQICNRVDSKIAIIADLKDGTVWAKQEDSDKLVTQQELKTIADTMKTDKAAFLQKGIYLAGEKYFCLHSEQNLVRGRKGSSALSIVATKTCLLVVATIDGFPPGILNQVVESLGEYLMTNDY